MNMKEHFDKEGFVVINNFLQQETVILLYHHVKIMAQRQALIMERKDKNLDIITDNKMFGTFNDEQVTGAFSMYGDPVMDSLCDLSHKKISEITSTKLQPTYSYYRLYFEKQKLDRHKDRPSCEFSTTICLGYDVSNVDKNVYPDYSWPIWVKMKSGKEMPVKMNPGDMLVYKGCDLEHWREKFKGVNHAQLFLHYNRMKPEGISHFDGRPGLGMPGYFKNYNVLINDDN